MIEKQKRRDYFGIRGCECDTDFGVVGAAIFIGLFLFLGDGSDDSE